ncbi:MAG TPA: sugar-binding transcriptional regulator [Stellaceae bacterium]|nr:sugar-binding transcriptional regulator [Stellaceae bacterium]
MDAAERDLAIKAAWLSYVAGLTQAEIADRLSVSRIKAHRLIAGAHEAGLVTVLIEGQPAACVALEDRLADRFELKSATIVPTLGRGDDTGIAESLPALGMAGARFLHHFLERDASSVIGIGWGRTLAALAERMPRIARPSARFVSLIGSLTRKAAANPFDVVHRLADRTGGEAYFLPVPFITDNVADAKVLAGQKSVRDVLALARQADLYVVSIGELTPSTHLRRSGLITEAEYHELRRAAAVGDVIGNFIGADGRVINAEINERALGLGLEELRGRQVIAVAGGVVKASAILAALRTGVITGLITDEAAAVAILTEADRRPALAI